jgi:hypothetical protein
VEVAFLRVKIYWFVDLGRLIQGSEWVERWTEIDQPVHIHPDDGN